MNEQTDVMQIINGIISLERQIDEGSIHSHRCELNLISLVQ